MANTTIEWTEKTWNPVTGCKKISTGCRNCYAERRARRLAGLCGYPATDPFQVTLRPDRLDEPLHWKKARMIFVCSMGDLFHEDVPFEYIELVHAAIRAASHHTFQILTKRPERMAEYWEWCNSEHLSPIQRSRPPENAWYGVSCENQAAADERIPRLLECPAAVRFVSLEPLLDPIDLSPWLFNASDLDWVIVGGESGPGARPMQPEWVRSIRDQCEDADVSFFFKQWGGVNKKKAGRILDGRTWDMMPAAAKHGFC